MSLQNCAELPGLERALVRPAGGDVLPSAGELRALFFQKYGDPKVVGWSQGRRYRFGYYLPADVYEAVVSKLVTAGAAWLDVGGGHMVFPQNAGLARELVGRCEKMVAVDPSENVHQNGFAHERVRSTLEEYRSEGRFDLATMRMVVEHVSDPEWFVGALGELVKPGGTAVIFTVNRRSPVTWISRVMPFWLHYPIKRMFWRRAQREDTFPAYYRMNSRSELRRLFERAGFEERAFAKLDDLSVFGFFKWLNYVELVVWRVLRRLHLCYPENCLLGVYRRRSDSVTD